MPLANTEEVTQNQQKFSASETLVYWLNVENDLTKKGRSLVVQQEEPGSLRAEKTHIYTANTRRGGSLGGSD